MYEALLWAWWSMVYDNLYQLSSLVLFPVLLDFGGHFRFFFPVYKLNTEISAYRSRSGYLSYLLSLFLCLHHSCMTAP